MSNVYIKQLFDKRNVIPTMISTVPQLLNSHAYEGCAWYVRIRIKVVVQNASCTVGCSPASVPFYGDMFARCMVYGIKIPVSFRLK